MRQRILAILAVGVAVLIIYTLAFKPKTTGAKVVGRVTGTHLWEVATTEVTKSTKTESMTFPQEEGSIPRPKTTGSSQVPNEPIEWGSDPFVREWILVSEVANLDLRAITVTSSGASALINNQILQVGDEILGKRVVSIDEDKVTLEQGGRTFTLTLGE